MANVVTEKETSKELNEKQKCIINLTKQLRENIAALTGSDKTRITLQIEVPEDEYRPWMDIALLEGKVAVAMSDDSLPF